ncbi:MAG: ABC transporter ATP-binding protein [bacterium]|nr:ABC transporter ATP-binding protein [bacterium]
MENQKKIKIKIRNLWKKLAAKTVLKGLDLDIYEGESVVIIGRSGEGKSVLLKHIASLLRPDEGEIHIDDKEITSLNDQMLTEVMMKIGMVFQNAALFDSLDVDNNVGFFMYRYRKDLTPEKIREIVKEKLALVELRDIMHLKPAELSGGMKKRVGLARAIAVEPQIILYDEPTTGLDPITADAINNLIINAKKKLNVTSIVVTHDMVSAYKIADRIAMLYDGKIIFSGTPDEIKSTDNPFVQQFINGRAEGPISA